MHEPYQRLGYQVERSKGKDGTIGNATRRIGAQKGRNLSEMEEELTTKRGNF